VGITAGRPGAVLVAQRFGSALNLNLHFQAIPENARPDGDGSFDLFSTSVTRGRPRRLNGRLVGGGSVTGYVLGPTGLVYRSDQDADEVFESPLPSGTPGRVRPK
jgi:hypothetical protein